MFNSLWYLLFTVITLLFVLLAFKLGQIWLTSLVACVVFLMNIFVLKQMTIFGMTVTGGNELYSSVFLSIDLISEHYGKKDAVRAVRIGFFVSTFFVIASQFVLHFQPNEFDFAQGSLETLFTLTPRIVAASMAAYLISQHLDVHIFHFIKDKTNGKHLWLRKNGSTFISQAVDSVTFTLLAFYGVFANEVIWQIILFTYLAKLIITILDTPFIYLSKLQCLKPLDKA